MCKLSVDFNSLVIVTAAAKTPSWALDSAPLLCVAYDVMTTAFVFFVSWETESCTIHLSQTFSRFRDS